MDSNQDVDTRIAALEQELAELRSHRPKATRVAPAPAMPTRRASAWWVAVSLFALSLPVATWMHGEARGAQASKLQRRALHTEVRMHLAERRHEVATRFLDVALDPGRSAADHDAALRYLATQLGDKSKLRRWAREELGRTEGATTGCSKRKAKAKAKALREAMEREHHEQTQRTAGSCG